MIRLFGERFGLPGCWLAGSVWSNEGGRGMSGSRFLSRRRFLARAAQAAACVAAPQFIPAG
ncbi:MAG TPA: twin-arginine translocation signal domain-containing protein, partial [Planctomycetes bacterium]|nr:twin-arginine translocation signal domain-containing protein [Planctomycetota bacterium]